ncbi:hypothetical protein B0H16DRAFT_1468442 [Mycena metata]|uniref:Uncharacterized protein n=1 Tax=Mycena metata TaxID=1033252 RepID=A0AAD7I149_9AGAR|nr:hypothetical protein B0H16DRAFT_1468442 [Mycena metata]
MRYDFFSNPNSIHELTLNAWFWERAPRHNINFSPTEHLTPRELEPIPQEPKIPVLCVEFDSAAPPRSNLPTSRNNAGHGRDSKLKLASMDSTLKQEILNVWHPTWAPRAQIGCKKIRWEGDVNLLRRELGFKPLQSSKPDYIQGLRRDSSAVWTRRREGRGRDGVRGNGKGKGKGVGVRRARRVGAKPNAGERVESAQRETRPARSHRRGLDSTRTAHTASAAECECRDDEGVENEGGGVREGGVGREMGDSAQNKRGRTVLTTFPAPSVYGARDGVQGCKWVNKRREWVGQVHTHWAGPAPSRSREKKEFRGFEISQEFPEPSESEVADAGIVKLVYDQI